MKQAPIWLIYSLLFLVMIIWGLNVVMLKVLVEVFPPATMTAFRIMTAGLVVLLLVVMLRSFKRLTKKEWGYVIVGTILGVYGHHFFLSFGLTMTTASNAVLILALVPLTTSLFAILFLNDYLTRIRFLGIILGLSGVFVILALGEGGFSAVSQGDLFVFISMFVQALSFIFIKKATRTLDAKQMTGMMLFIGSLLLFGTSLYIEPSGLQGMTEGTAWLWFIFFFSAVIATGLGHVFFNEAIHRLGAGQTAIFNNFVPFFGLISSAVFLDEAIYPSQVLGLVLIVGGVLLGTGHVDAYLLQKKQKMTVNEKSM
ncbi:DMT family transporter [Halalkalibacterium ligniniphilum]|uniref:DMT family transporter n=1 Tax=Halalkalibacterium ligniniphilum TaxID=1134413 RepID=UPI00034DFDAD|nr:DMT family transporter [Halalkalibacterium ligniniphilum]